jgi:hypothetical protein
LYAIFREEADFREATFSEMVYFTHAVFIKGAVFGGATFSKGVLFSEANFYDRASFYETTFSDEAYFNKVAFSDEAVFDRVAFSKGVYFSGATFKEGALFYTLNVFPRTALVFSGAIIEKPERMYFHTSFLRPSWFVDVDAQKFDFSDVVWFRIPHGSLQPLTLAIPDASEPDTDELKPLTLENEIENLVVVVEGQPEDETSWSQGSRTRNLRKLTKACRRLMNNAEENRDYPTANEMHYWSMEAQRKEGWSRLGLIATLYWALSGYGERPLRAFGVLVVIYAVFAVLYMLLPSSPFSVLSTAAVCEYLGCVGEAATYSLSALARLLPAEPRLSPGLFQFLVTVEGILGPLQIALFFLAVRRKVMR